MSWQFEWNWLGYVWAFLIGGALLVVALLLVGEIGSMVKTGYSTQGTPMMIGIMSMLVVSNSLLLGLLTIFVWDFKTALWLGGGAVVLLALLFAVAYSLIALLRKS